jgi:hypothetical protein
MEYKIADLNLKKVNLISGNNNKLDGYLKKGGVGAFPKSHRGAKDKIMNNCDKPLKVLEF